MARMQRIKDWANDEFGENPPSYATLLFYAKNKMIFPHPKKAGRTWWVEKTARFVGISNKPIIKKDDDDRLKRILSDGTST
ncbi:excisionase [Sodalis glossinidius]|uniref:excisionase n=1 Tax=Sodalis glossinidius TaxID=63612 RepID=UPI0005A4ADB5|nr:excisionase [Sodalis glossinidius]